MKPVFGFWKTFVSALKGALLSRDTLAIFAGAVAFYLIFYAWPYGNQQIEHIPAAVCDLDRSDSSRRLILEIGASPAVDVMMTTGSEGEALDALRTEKVPVLITIPKDYEKTLARGGNTTVHVTGNGAFPVKIRAVQSAVAGVVQDKSRLLDSRAVFATGLPGTSAAGSYAAPPSLRVQYRYNEIGGYGNYTVPVVGPIILQAIMLMGVTIALGGWLCSPRRPDFLPGALLYPGRLGSAVFLAFWMMAFMWFVYMQAVDFRFHEYGSMANPAAVLLTGLLFSASVTAFAMTISLLLGSNRWSSQAIVMTSAPAVFLSGGIWPLESITHPAVYAFSLLFPTTPAIRALLAASQDGAATGDLLMPLGVLLAQTAGYLCLSAWLAGRRLTPEPVKRFSENDVI